MIILSVLPIFFVNSYIFRTFALSLVFALIYSLIRRFAL